MLLEKQHHPNQQKVTPGHRILQRSEYKALPNHVQKALTKNPKPVEYIKEISNHVTGVVVCYRIKYEDQRDCQLIGHTLLKMPKTQVITDYDTLPASIRNQLDMNTISVTQVSSYDDKVLYYRVSSKEILTKRLFVEKPKSSLIADIC